LGNSEFVDQNTVFVEDFDAGREIKRDIDVFRNKQKLKRSVRRRNILEFRDIVRDTAAASANYVVTEFVRMSEILSVHWRDVGTRLRPLLLFDKKI